VFAEVLMGMEVIQAIQAVPTGVEDIPTKKIVIDQCGIA
jgi:hypothetical protein